MTPHVVQEVRRVCGWTQYDLAKASGVGRTRISLFENGHIVLQPEEVAAIDSALNRAIAERLTNLRSLTAGVAPVAVSPKTAPGVRP